MSFQEINIKSQDALELQQFREMDYFAVEHYNLPIELMMENAGLQLANLIAGSVDNPKAKILIGVGNGNNGGGGLVAARRLAAWGYAVFLDCFTEIDKELPKRQFERARKFGVHPSPISHPDVWVDAYLGFSQRLPLKPDLITRIEEANNCKCLRIALDIPTGFLGDVTTIYFQADKVLTLAAGKKILYHLPDSTELYVADLGIPESVYQNFGTSIPPFGSENILRLVR